MTNRTESLMFILRLTELCPWEFYPAKKKLILFVRKMHSPKPIGNSSIYICVFICNVNRTWTWKTDQFVLHTRMYENGHKHGEKCIGSSLCFDRECIAFYMFYLYIYINSICQRFWIRFFIISFCKVKYIHLYYFFSYV